MDWTRVKTILICFLLLVNTLLGVVLSVRAYERASEKRDAATAARDAIGAFGIEIDVSLLLDHPERIYPMEEERSAEAEQAAFSSLLTNPVTEQQGGGIYQITGENGSVRLRNAGAFEAEFSAGENFLSDRGKELFGLMGISGAHDNITEEEDRLQGVQTVGGAQVFNMRYQARQADGQAVSFSGSRLMGEIYISSSSQCKSASTVLIAFARRIKEQGARPQRIEDMELGYYAELAAPGYTALNPCWKVTTDAGVWYVDAITFEVK